MEKTPKLPRKSLSLCTRLRSRSSASPGSRIKNTLIPSSPISPECGLECTPPNRKHIFNPPYSPTNEFDFSPRSTFSQSSTNSPEVTWRWTQDDHATDNSSPSSTLAKTAPNSTGVKELRKKRSVERKEELRKAELEKRKANRTKREIVLKQQREQMELLISNKSNTVELSKSDDSPLISKERSLSNSSGYGSNTNIDNVIDLLNDSESDGLLLEATQKVETNIEKDKNNTIGDVEQLCVEESHQREKPPVCEYLHDSLDDWFASLDADLLAAQPKKPRTSLQRYKSMPTNSPVPAQVPDTSKIKRYPSSSTLPPKSSLSEDIDIFTLLKHKLKENQNKVRCGEVESFQKTNKRFN